MNKQHLKNATMKNTPRNKTFFHSLAIALTALFASIAIVFSCARVAYAAGIPADAVTGGTDYYNTYDFKVINDGWENMTDGGLVHVRIYRPKVSAGPYPAVVISPPPDRAEVVTDLERRGTDIGREMDAAAAIAEKGVAVVLYNPPGQGSGDYGSGGQDGRGGYLSQDALAQVIRAVRGVSFIDASNIGVVSQGGGLSSAAGALARHTDLGVKYLIDIEGQWDNQEMTGYTWSKVTEEIGWKHVIQSSLYYQHLPTAQDQDPETEWWWSRREPKNFADQMLITYYQRVQFEIDEEQPPDYYGHALRMYDALLGSQVPHVRFNHSAWDAELPPARVPQLIPGKLDANYIETITAWTLEFAFMKEPPPARVLPPAVKPDVTPLPVPSTGY